MAEFSLLPAEILELIIYSCPPGDRLNIVLTCRRVAACSSPILRRHREAHETCRAVSDLHPSTIPRPLRNLVLGDGVEAWHVHSLEIWTWRCKRDHWRCVLSPRYGIEQPAGPSDPPFHLSKSEEPLWSYDDPAEIDQYLEILTACLGWPTAMVDHARTKIQDYDDQAIKCLLIALCPRLRSVKLVRGAHGDDLQELDELKTLLGYISLTVIIKLDNDKASWTPGFKSLQEVCVGAHSGTSLDHYHTEHRPHLLTALVMLPNIRSIYYHNYDEQRGIQVNDHRLPVTSYRNLAAWKKLPAFPREVLNHPEKWLSPCGSSTLEHLYLDHSSTGMHPSYYKPLFHSLRGLKTLCLRGNGMWSDWECIDDIVVTALSAQKDSLETLLQYGTRGMRKALYNPDGGDLGQSSTLKTLSVPAEDMFISTHRRFGVPGDMAKLAPYFFLGDEERQECIDTIVGMLPVNLEVLVLTLTIHGTWVGFADMGNILPSAEPDDWDDEALDDKTLDRRDRNDIPTRERSVFVASVCLVHLIKRRPALKTIFIDWGNHWPREYRPHFCAWFRRVVRTGEQHGVAVYLGNEDRHGLHFPAVPDLESGLNTKPRDEGPWEIDPCIMGAGDKGHRDGLIRWRCLIDC